MPIIDLQRGIVEAGRIRIGQQVPTTGGRTRPEKLTTFRLTSSDKRRIEQAAALFGGKVEAWEAPAGPQWQVITTSDSLEVIIPPSDLSFSQNYELWSAGGAQRRCNGVTEQISQQPCRCDPEARECDIHSRLSVLIRDLPGLGVWRLDTSGWYAAKELAGAVQIIQLAAGVGTLLPARLRLEQRSAKRPDAKGKPQTLRYAVPVLDIEVTPAQLLAGQAGGEPLQLVAQGAPLTPVPQLAPPSIAEQSAPPPARPPRKGAGPELPASGRRRNTAAPDPTPAAVAASPARAADDRPDRPPDFSGLRGTQQASEPGAGSPPARPRGGTASSSGEADPAPADRSDPQYWPNRVHAAAAEHDIDHDGVRLIGAAVAYVANDALAEWSSRNLTPEQWETVDKLMRRLPKPLDQDAASKWLFTVATSTGLVVAGDEAGWQKLDTLAAVVYRAEPDDLTPAHWIALGLRMVAGEYNPDTVEAVA